MSRRYGTARPSEGDRSPSDAGCTTTSTKSHFGRAIKKNERRLPPRRFHRHLRAEGFRHRARTETHPPGRTRPNAGRNACCSPTRRRQHGPPSAGKHKHDAKPKQEGTAPVTQTTITTGRHFRPDDPSEKNASCGFFRVDRAASDRADRGISSGEIKWRGKKARSPPRGVKAVGGSHEARRRSRANFGIRSLADAHFFAVAAEK